MTLSLVTGVGSKGQVGEAVAGLLARRGDRVVIVSRNPNEIAERVAELRSAGGDVFGYACDLANEGAVRALVDEVFGAHGDRVDNVVNLAGGFASSGHIAASESTLVSRMWAINFTTAYLTTRACLPLMQRGGSIVYFASEVVLPNTPSSGVVAYAAAKSAVAALMRSVADEGRSRGIRANALAPGSIRTASNTSSMGKDASYVEREEVADAVAFLCSSSSEAVSGQVIRLSPRKDV